MENVNIADQASKTAKHIEVYVKNQMELYKMQFSEKLARISSFLIFAFFASLILLLFITMLSIAFGIFLTNLLGNAALAFLIVSASYALLLGLLLLLKKPVLDNPILRAFLKEFNDLT